MSSKYKLYAVCVSGQVYKTKATTIANAKNNIYRKLRKIIGYVNITDVKQL